MKLTDELISSYQPKEKSYKRYDGESLYIEVMPNGNKGWRFKYKFEGKEKRLSFGPYPEVGIFNARAFAHVMRLHLKEGRDPSSLSKKPWRTRGIKKDRLIDIPKAL